MITGVHTILYAHHPEQARAFLSEVLGLPSVDAGRGWLIFALPPGEVAFHPTDDPDEAGRCQLYLLCDDLDATMAQLSAKGAQFTGEIQDHRWGRLATLKIPGAGDLGLYQPKHPVAAGMPL